MTLSTESGDAADGVARNDNGTVSLESILCTDEG